MISLAWVAHRVAPSFVSNSCVVQNWPGSAGSGVVVLKSPHRLPVYAAWPETSTVAVLKFHVEKSAVLPVITAPPANMLGFELLVRVIPNPITTSPALFTPTD